MYIYAAQPLRSLRSAPAQPLHSLRIASVVRHHARSFTDVDQMSVHLLSCVIIHHPSSIIIIIIIIVIIHHSSSSAAAARIIISTSSSSTAYELRPMCWGLWAARLMPIVHLVGSFQKWCWGLHQMHDLASSTSEK